MDRDGKKTDEYQTDREFRRIRGMVAKWQCSGENQAYNDNKSMK